MPVIAAIGVGLTALGGGSALAGAAIAGSAIAGGASIIGANQASKAAKNATAAQTTANNAALAEQQRQYDTTRADYAPWRQAGESALQQLSAVHGITLPGGPQAPNDPYAGFMESPDYQFRRDEGIRAISGNRSARGLLDSPSHGEGLIRYAGQAASAEFGNWYSRLAALAGVGQAATDSIAGAGQANANNRTGILQQQGQNLASSIATQGGISAGLTSQLGGIASGLIQNYPQSQTIIPAPTAISAYNPAPITAAPVTTNVQGLITPTSSGWGSVV